MTRMDRYLLGEMVMPFFGGIMLIIVTLIGNTLFPLIQPIVENGIPLKVVAKLVVFNIPTLVVLTLPAGVALSAAWAVNRMARDSEITAIRMAGVPLRRIFLPIWVMGALTSAASFLIGDRVVPTAQHQFQETQGQMLAYAIQASPALAANKVFTYQNYSFHIREVNKDPSGDPNKLKLSGVTIYENPSDNGYPILMTAATADYNKDVWTLHNVVMHSIGPDGFTRLEIAGETTTLNLRVPLNLAASDYLRPDELTMHQLGQQMAVLARTHQDYTTVAVNYYMKLSLPLICLAFALCAPPLALRFSRAGAYMGIFLSLVMVWVAWNTLLLAKILGISGKLDPIIAAWSPAVLFGLAGMWLLRKAE